MKTNSSTIFIILASHLVATSLAFSLGKTNPSSLSATKSFSLNSIPKNNNDEENEERAVLPDRRQWFQHQAAMIAGGFLTSTLQPTPAALASSGLLVFPISPETQLLKNRYHFMRAGVSELEMDGIYSTNALFLTNRENSMHPSAEKVILESLKKLKTETDGFPTILYHSLAANGMDTGDFIARQLNLGREKTLPEFTYLDQRGIGLWDSGDEKLVKPAIWALDHAEAGKLGFSGRPPNNDDGTASETLHDQFIRLRQFISLQESRTSGDNILVIFPDGTGPALLSCMIAGIPYKDVHALEFAPGEIRLDITPESVLALFEQKKDDPAYLAALEDGKQKLKALREDNVFVNIKEQRSDNENMQMDAEYNEKKMEAERERLRKMAEERAIREEAEAKAREERERQRLERMEAEKRLKEEREQQRQQAVAAAREARIEKERQRRLSQQKDSNSVQSSSNQGSSSPFSMPVVGATGIVGLGLAAAVGSMMGSDDNDDDTVGVETKEEPKPILNATESATIESTVPELEDTAGSLTPESQAVNDTIAMDPVNATAATTLEPLPLQNDMDIAPAPVSGADEMAPEEENQQTLSDITANSMSTNDMGDTEDDLDSVDVVGVSSDEVVENQLAQLAVQEQALKDALSEAKNGSSMDDDIMVPRPSAADDSSNKVDDFLNELDSFDSDWLQLMQDIQNEEVEEHEESFEWP